MYSKNKKLKILQLSYVPHSERYSNDAAVFEELGKQANVVFVNLRPLRKPLGAIEARIDELMEEHTFDLIYKNFMGETINSLKMRPLCEYGLPVFISSGDCHTRLTNDIYNERANHHEFDVIIVNNKSTIEPFKDYFDRKMNYIWLPWSYNPEAHLDYGQKKKYDVCFPVGQHKHVPMRSRIHKYLTESSHEYRWIHGLPPAEFGKRINQCKVGVSTCQKDERLYYKGKFIGMTFNKYYEIPMCGTLHIGQRSADAEDLGFVDGKNVVMFDTFEEFKDKLNFYLKHDGERLRIIEASRKHVEPMMYKNRIKKFLEDARKFI